MMLQDNKGTSYLLYKSQGTTYEAELTLVDNREDTVTIVCDFQVVEEAICQEIAEWDEVLQRSEMTVLGFCHIRNELQKYVELATYKVTIRVVEDGDEVHIEDEGQIRDEIQNDYKEVNVMDYATYNKYKALNQEN